MDYQTPMALSPTIELIASRLLLGIGNIVDFICGYEDDT